MLGAARLSKPDPTQALLLASRPAEAEGLFLQPGAPE